MSMSAWEVIASGSATVSTPGTKSIDSDFGFSAAQLAAMRKARISAMTNAVTFRQDGTSPTATVGHPIAAGEMIEIDGYNNLVNLEMIRSGAGDAVVTVTIYGAL